MCMDERDVSRSFRRARRAAVTALARGAGAVTVAGSRTGQSQTLVQLA